MQYTCMDVCTQPSTTSCAIDGNVTTWPVVAWIYSCPNNASGTVCPDGSAGDDFLSAQYGLGTEQDRKSTRLNSSH